MADFPLPSAVGRVVANFTNATVAGAEISDTVPAGHSWYVLNVQQTLTKGAAGGTPTPMLQVVDSRGTIVVGPIPGASVGQALSTVTTYNWGPGLPLSGQLFSGGTHFTATAPLPQDLIVMPGWSIQTSTINTVGGTSSYGTPCYLICDLGTGQ